MLPEEIKTIDDSQKFIFKEKSSEFIAEVFPTSSEDDAMVPLLSLKKRYFDATHHCFAYKIHQGLEKYSDDGEPRGSAGIRILNAINHFDLTDLILIVTRYFGGTKLGVGPLGKAYYNASIGALEKSKIITLELFQQITIVSDYENISIVHRFIDEYKAKIVKSEFSQLAKFVCNIKPAFLQNICLELKNSGNGKISVSVSEKFTYEKNN